MQDRESSAGNKAGISLQIVTPQGVAYAAQCDSVTLPLADGKDGAGGGSIGIRKGHIRAELALSAGIVRAMEGGALLCAVTISGGFASVGENAVTVIADHAERVESKAPDAESGDEA